MLNTWVEAAVLLVCLTGLTAAVAARRRQVALDSVKLAAAAGIPKAHQVKQAKAFFETITGQKPPTHFTEFVGMWTKRARQPTGLKSLQKGGRPPILQPELVDTIAREWTQAGTGRGADWRGYTSMEEVRTSAGAPSRHAPTTRRRRRRPPLVISAPQEARCTAAPVPAGNE